MSTPPFVRLYANDWFTGVAGLKADERGVYISMCVFIWTTGRRVPLDDAEASRLMALNFKSYQRVRDRLVVLGKVTKHENGYGNERAEHELAAASEAVESTRRSKQETDRGNGSGEEKPAAPSAPPAQDAEATKPVLNDAAIDRAIDDGIDHAIDRAIDRQKDQRNQHPSIEPEPEPFNIVGGSACASLLDGLQTKLEEAAGHQLENYARSPGLMNLSIPLMWLEQGCDLERDVLPAVRQVADSRRGKAKITHWNYFTQAVSNAKNDRERGLPPPVESSSVPGHRSQRDIDRASRKQKSDEGLAFIKSLEAKASAGVQP